MSIGQIETKDLFNYELSFFPTSLYNESGLPHYTTTKYDWKNLLNGTVSNRNIQFDVIVIDGYAMLYSATSWSKELMSRSCSWLIQEQKTVGIIT